jgi:hypothetical protein
MKLGISVFVVALLLLATAPAVAGDDADSKLIATEKSLWEAWKNQDAGPFDTHLVDAAVTITPGGMTTGKAAVIKELAGGTCDVESYSLANFKVHHVGKGVAILTYEASQDAVCDGNKIPAKVIASSVYVNQEGKWLSASYHESRAPEE